MWFSRTLIGPLVLYISQGKAVKKAFLSCLGGGLKCTKGVDDDDDELNVKYEKIHERQNSKSSAGESSGYGSDYSPTSSDSERSSLTSFDSLMQYGKGDLPDGFVAEHSKPRRAVVERAPVTGYWNSQPPLNFVDDFFKAEIPDSPKRSQWATLNVENSEKPHKYKEMKRVDNKDTIDGDWTVVGEIPEVKGVPVKASNSEWKHIGPSSAGRKVKRFFKKTKRKLTS